LSTDACLPWVRYCSRTHTK